MLQPFDLTHECVIVGEKGWVFGHLWFDLLRCLGFGCFDPDTLRFGCCHFLRLASMSFTSQMHVPPRWTSMVVKYLYLFEWMVLVRCSRITNPRIRPSVAVLNIICSTRQRRSQRFNLRMYFCMSLGDRCWTL